MNEILGPDISGIILTYLVPVLKITKTEEFNFKVTCPLCKIDYIKLIDDEDDYKYYCDDCDKLFFINVNYSELEQGKEYVFECSKILKMVYDELILDPSRKLSVEEIIQIRNDSIEWLNKEPIDYISKYNLKKINYINYFQNMDNLKNHTNSKKPEYFFQLGWPVYDYYINFPNNFYGEEDNTFDCKDVHILLESGEIIRHSDAV